MSDFVTKVKKGSSVKPIHDARIPNASAGDAGKTLKFDENGNLIASSTGSLEDIESQVELLQEAIEGKVAFDGEVKLRGHSTLEGLTIPFDDNPKKSGVYIAVNGDENDDFLGILVMEYSQYHVTSGMILSQRGLFNVSGGGYGTATISKIEYGTKIYKHSLSYGDGHTSRIFYGLDSRPLANDNYATTVFGKMLNTVCLYYGGKYGYLKVENTGAPFPISLCFYPFDGSGRQIVINLDDSKYWGDVVTEL